MAKRNDIENESKSTYIVNSDQLKIHVSTNVTFRIVQDKMTLYLRECKIQNGAQEYVKELIKTYFTIMYTRNDADKIQNIILEDLKQKANFTRFMKLEYVYNSHIKEMRSLSFNHYELVGLPSLSLLQWNGIVPFLKYCKGGIINYLNNRYLAKNSFQNYNFNRQKSTRVLAELLNIEFLVPDIEICKLKVDDATELLCSVMPEVGHASPCNIAVSDRAHYSYEFVRQLSILELFDALCYQLDHRLGNYNIFYGNSGQIDGVSAFDNDAPLTFIPFWRLPSKTYCGCSSVLRRLNTYNRPYVDWDFYENLKKMNYSLIYNSLKDYLTSAQIHGLWRRICALRRAIRTSIERRECILLSNEKWNTFDPDKELSGAYGMTYFKYYYEVDEIKEIEEKIGVNNVTFDKQ